MARTARRLAATTRSTTVGSRPAEPQYCVERLLAGLADDGTIPGEPDQAQRNVRRYDAGASSGRGIRSLRWSRRDQLAILGALARRRPPERRIIPSTGTATCNRRARAATATPSGSLHHRRSSTTATWSGIVPQSQLYFDERYSGVYLIHDVPDVRLAEAYRRGRDPVDSPEEVDTAIEKACAVRDHSVVIVFRSTRARGRRRWWPPSIEQRHHPWPEFALHRDSRGGADREQQPPAHDLGAHRSPPSVLTRISRLFARAGSTSTRSLSARRRRAGISR